MQISEKSVSEYAGVLEYIESSIEYFANKQEVIKKKCDNKENISLVEHEQALENGAALRVLGEIKSAYLYFEQQN